MLDILDTFCVCQTQMIKTLTYRSEITYQYILFFDYIECIIHMKCVLYFMRTWSNNDEQDWHTIRHLEMSKASKIMTTTEEL